MQYMPKHTHMILYGKVANSTIYTEYSVETSYSCICCPVKGRFIHTNHQPTSTTLDSPHAAIGKDTGSAFCPAQLRTQESRHKWLAD